MSFFLLTFTYSIHKSLSLLHVWGKERSMSGDAEIAYLKSIYHSSYIKCKWLLGLFAWCNRGWCFVGINRQKARCSSSVKWRFCWGSCCCCSCSPSTRCRCRFLHWDVPLHQHLLLKGNFSKFFFGCTIGYFLSFLPAPSYTTIFFDVWLKQTIWCMYWIFVRK